MVSLEKLFTESKGQPIELDGKILQMVDRVPVRDGQGIRIVFESASPERRQGISLTVRGELEVNGHTIRKEVVLWVDTAPTEVILQVRTKQHEVLVKNVWDRGDGVMDSWHAQAAMIVETCGAVRRYRCNDGRNNLDFEDIVFTLECLD